MERAIFLELIAGKIPDSAWVGDGILINSDFLNGLNTQQATEKMIDWLVEKRIRFCAPLIINCATGFFPASVIGANQFPIVICPHCGQVPVPEKDLPVVLPEVENYRTTETGDSPLSLILIGLMCLVRNAVKMLNAKLIPCLNGPAHPGIFCVMLIRIIIRPWLILKN